MTPALEKLSENIAPLNPETISKLKHSGVYAIWWTGSIRRLKSLNRKIYFQGKMVTKDERAVVQILGDYHIHETKWNWNMGNGPVCLYVGKASNISKRIMQHLELRTSSENWYTVHNVIRNGKKKEITPDATKDFLVKRSSGCQVRAGIEHLYKNQPTSSIQEKLKHFGISFYHETDFVNRFYLEDLAIGYFRPWFNLDSER